MEKVLKMRDILLFIILLLTLISCNDREKYIELDKKLNDNFERGKYSEVIKIANSHKQLKNSPVNKASLLITYDKVGSDSTLIYLKDFDSIIKKVPFLNKKVERKFYKDALIIALKYRKWKKAAEIIKSFQKEGFSLIDKIGVTDYQTKIQNNVIDILEKEKITEDDLYEILDYYFSISFSENRIPAEIFKHLTEKDDRYNIYAFILSVYYRNPEISYETILEKLSISNKYNNLYLAGKVNESIQKGDKDSFYRFLAKFYAAEVKNNLYKTNPIVYIRIYDFFKNISITTYDDDEFYMNIYKRITSIVDNKIILKRHIEVTHAIVCYRYLDKKEKTVKILENLKKDPNTFYKYNVYTFLASIYYSMGNNEKAYENFKKGVEFDKKLLKAIDSKFYNSLTWKGLTELYKKYKKAENG